VVVLRSDDLIVVEVGSGNMLLGEDLAHRRTAITKPSRFGGRV
jgi:hypothetical protein